MKIGYARLGDQALLFYSFCFPLSLCAQLDLVPRNALWPDVVMVHSMMSDIATPISPRLPLSFVVVGIGMDYSAKKD